MSLRAELLRFVLRHAFKAKAADVPPDIPAIRRNLEAAKRFIPNPPNGTVASNVAAGGAPAIRVTTARSRNDCHVLYLHGGAYVYGSPSMYRDFIWRIADAARTCVLCLDYRLAPEHPFPAALDDAVSAYRWMIGEGADPAKMAIMGDSAGGGLTFATLLRLRDEGIPLPAAAVAISPWTDLTLTSASVQRNAQADPMLNAHQARIFAASYAAGTELRHPSISPLFGDPTGLPPSLLLVGEDEILHDDAAQMAGRLRAAGCRAELEVWPRMMHVWPLFARILPEGRAAIARIGAFIQRHLAERRLAEK